MRSKRLTEANPNQLELGDLATGSGTLNLPSKDAAETLANTLTRRIARHFQGLRDPAMLQSGQDSGLKNLWDEICVQQQAFESGDWRLYTGMIERAITACVEDLSQSDRQTLWVLTETGWSWHYDASRGFECAEKEAIPNDDEMVAMMTVRLLSFAADYSNARIRTYLDQTAW